MDNLNEQLKTVEKGTWLFVWNPYCSDPKDPTKQAVDCGLYLADFAPALSDKATDSSDVQNRRINWSRIDLPIECKSDIDADPLDDTRADCQAQSSTGQATLGQILSYAEIIFQHQHRQFIFMVLLLGDYARIVRFDHSGLCATKRFNYKTDGRKLAAFYRAYMSLGDAQRGYDPSATRLDPESPYRQKMRDLCARAMEIDPEEHSVQMFAESLDESWPWWRLQVTVVDEEETENEHDEHPRQPRRPPRVFKFLVGRPHFQADGVVGRATRGFVAVGINDKNELVDCDGAPLLYRRKLLCDSFAEAYQKIRMGQSARPVESCFVHLKDAWRVDHPGVEKEGLILTRLNNKGVKHIPTLICHADLPGQVTCLRDLWIGLNPDKDESECRFERHQHSRLIVKQVGKPLSCFRSGRQFLSALWYAITGECQFALIVRSTFLY